MGHRAVLLFVALGLPCAAAEQMVRIEQEVTREQVQGQPALTATQRIWFTERLIRSELSFGGRTSWTFVDLAEGRVAIVPRVQEREVVELALADFQRLVAMRLRGLADGALALEHTALTRQIGPWTCTLTRLSAGGPAPIRIELWLAPGTGVAAATWLSSMRILGLPVGALESFEPLQDGLPIALSLEETAYGQHLVTTIQIKAIEHLPFDPILFELPQGFRRIQADPLPKSP